MNGSDCWIAAAASGGNADKSLMAADNNKAEI